MNVVRLSALRTGCLYLPGNNPGTHFCQRLSRPLGHSAARRITSIKNPNDTTGNRTRELPFCSAVPQPTVPQCAPSTYVFRTFHTAHSHKYFPINHQMVWLTQHTVQCEARTATRYFVHIYVCLQRGRALG